MHSLFHPLFRHLWYLSGLAILGMLVIGFAYEKFNGATSGLAMIGLTTAAIHSSAWWFTFGVAAPWKKFLFCVLFFAALLSAAFLGRSAFLLIANANFDSLYDSMKLVAIVVPPWWISMVIVNELFKLVMRWSLRQEGELLTSPVTISHLMQLTAIFGITFAFSRQAFEATIDIDYLPILYFTIALNVALVNPLTAELLRERIYRKTSRLSKLAVFAILFLLIIFVLAGTASTEMRVKDVGVAFGAGIIAWLLPFLIAVLSSREKHLSLTSGWSQRPVR